MIIRLQIELIMLRINNPQFVERRISIIEEEYSKDIYNIGDIILCLSLFQDKINELDDNNPHKNQIQEQFNDLYLRLMIKR